MKWLRPVVFLFISTALFYLLNNVIGQVPPLGKFLNPFAGFWQNNTSTDEILANHEIPGLREEVKIAWDDRRVPHIFARNEHDLYLT
ncbi:MAG: penicillin acylase family protein, partial [Planctomycetota bacterium]